MKMKYEFEKVIIDDEIICIPVGTVAQRLNAVLKLNETGYEILELLKNEISEEQIVDILVSRYETAPETIREYVNKAVGVLRDNNLIE